MMLRQILGKFSGMRWASAILVAFFVAHTAWALNHARLHFLGVVNPWKLGGYAMYVQPARGLTINIAHIPRAASESLQWRSIRKANATNLLTEEGAIFLFGNKSRILRCRPVPEYALRGFLRANRALIGDNVRIRFVENGFEDGVATRTLQGEVFITYDAETGRPKFVQKFCQA